MDKYNIINILDLVDNIGEQEVNNSISSFRCDKNKEIKHWNHFNYKQTY